MVTVLYHSDRNLPRTEIIDSRVPWAQHSLGLLWPGRLITVHRRKYLTRLYSAPSPVEQEGVSTSWSWMSDRRSVVYTASSGWGHPAPVFSSYPATQHIHTHFLPLSSSRTQGTRVFFQEAHPDHAQPGLGSSLASRHS